MRNTLLLVFITVLQAYANDTYSQNTKLTLSLNNVTVANVLEEIQNNSEFYFLFNAKLVDVEREVSISMEDKKISEILTFLFSGTGVNYLVYDRQIILTPSDVTSLSAAMQQLKIAGTVTGKDGTPLPGVNVVIVGTTTGTITDIAGKYSIEVPQGAKSLTFSFIGMESQEITIGALTQINVTMVDSSIGLDEVVVIGYGTAKKATLTGSVSAVHGDKLEVAKSVNFANSLAGRIPGLVVVSGTGVPGNDDPIIRIRGNNTLNDNSPLIVVDGIANRSLFRLDAEDIESVTVLKDASAAIYGAQAANGVILVTTKRGSTGKLKIDASFSQGFSAPTVIPKMADAYSFASMLNEIDKSAGYQSRYTEDDLQKFKDGSDPYGHPNTDWFKEALKPFSLERKGNIDFSGGSESVKYFVSLGTLSQDAPYRKSGSNYTQANFRSNVDFKVSNNINFSIDLSGRNENRTGTTSGLTPSIALEPWAMILSGRPTETAWWWNGLPGPEQGVDYNPVVAATNIPGTDKSKSYIMESKMKLDINIPWVRGLSFTGNVSIDKGLQTGKLWLVPFYLYTWDKITYDDAGLPLLQGSKCGISQPALTQSSSDNSLLTLNILVNYERTIAKNHRIKILAGSESSLGKLSTFSASRKYFVSDAIDELFAGSNLEKNNNGSSRESARLNYFGRVNYDYLSKYLVEFVGRYDGSMNFPADKRWGFFPGFSLGWVASEENFWKNNLAFINYFKLRGSWGQTGNDRINDFQYLSTYGFGDWGGLYGGFNMGEWVTNTNVINKVLVEQKIPNLNVTWEVANQTDIGFDAQMLGGKLKLEGDYFHNLRSNILTQRNASIPTSSGLALPPENIGEVVNQGFEFVVSYGDKSGNFGYNVSINGGYAKNKINFWDETPGIPDYQQTTGHPMNSGLYYQAIGIFKDQAAVDAYPHWAGARPGDIIFEDVSKDGVIDGLDRVRDYRSNIPTFTGGLNIDLTYKNFYATALFQGAFGATMYEVTFGGSAGNFLMDQVKGRWTEDNPDATVPRAFNFRDEYWSGDNNPNTYWLRNCDYMRLKNIEIGYNIPESINTKFGIDGFRIYVSGLNLITWHPGNPNFDPEAAGGILPVNKVINVGVKISF